MSQRRKTGRAAGRAREWRRREEEEEEEEVREAIMFGLEFVVKIRSGRRRACGGRVVEGL
jgi:hypothetical protein